MTIPPQATEGLHDLCRFLRIKPGRGFIKGDHPWLHGDDAGHSQALPLTPRKSARIDCLPVEEANLLKGRIDLFGAEVAGIDIF